MSEQNQGSSWGRILGMGLLAVAAGITAAVTSDDQEGRERVQQYLTDSRRQPQPQACIKCSAALSQPIKYLACGHKFHKQCVIQHFHYSSVCPLCGCLFTQQQIQNYKSRW